jgi:hypothetical protein
MSAVGAAGLPPRCGEGDRDELPGVEVRCVEDRPGGGRSSGIAEQAAAARTPVVDPQAADETGSARKDRAPPAARRLHCPGCKPRRIARCRRPLWERLGQVDAEHPRPWCGERAKHVLGGVDGVREAGIVDVVADEAPPGIRPCVCVGCRPAVTAGRSGYPHTRGDAASVKRGINVDRCAGSVSGCAAHRPTESDHGSEHDTAEHAAQRCRPPTPSRWPRSHATALTLARSSEQLLPPTLPRA